MNDLLKNSIKHHWQLILIALLIISLFISRAGLSILSIIIILPVFFNQKRNVPEAKKIVIGFILIILPLLLSFFWSHNKQLWLIAFTNKIPLLTIPTALISFNLKNNTLKRIIEILAITVTAACIWSLLFFFNNSIAITNSYLVAKVMPTPLDDDHIRFSWLIVITIILLIQQLLLQSLKYEKIIGSFLVVFLIIFLHFLAAKTGLVCLYASIAIFIFYNIFLYKNKKWGFGLLLIIIGFSSIAYYSFTTLRNRIQYVVWDFKQYTAGKFLNGSADGDRILSFKAAIDIANTHPFIGVGFGDLKSEINNWHQQHHPQSEEYERFNPTNEWLTYAAASGWLGMIVFSIGIYFICSLIFSKNIFAVCLLTTTLLPIITDDSLEGQFGVAIFSLAISLGYSVLKKLN